MRELRATSINGKMYLFPVPVIKERKYLIYCSHENEANMIINDIKNKKLVHPDLLSKDFLYLCQHTDHQTKIFVLNPERSK